MVLQAIFTISIFVILSSSFWYKGRISFRFWNAAFNFLRRSLSRLFASLLYLLTPFNWRFLRRDFAFLFTCFCVLVLPLKFLTEKSEYWYMLFYQLSSFNWKNLADQAKLCTKICFNRPYNNRTNWSFSASVNETFV